MRPIAIAFLSLVLMPASSLAWTGAPLLVDGVTSGPQSVAVAHDGAYGALVAWQSAGVTGELRVTHLLADGAHDPAWPMGGLALANGGAARTGLSAESDGVGGAYLCWLEGRSLYITRLTAAGVAPGWTARGRALGALTSASHRPWTQVDATGGIYVGWFQGIRTELSTPSVMAIHLGPNGSGAGGWPAGARSLPLSPDHLEWVHSASFGVADDGGIWVLIATGREQEGEMRAGEWRLGRWLPTGQRDPAHPVNGAVLGAFEADELDFNVPRLSLGALITDGEGGVLGAQARVYASGAGSWGGHYALARRTATGALHPGQGAARNVGWFYEYAGTNPAQYAAYSLQLRPDGLGGIALAYPEVYTHAGFVYRLSTVDAFGVPTGALSAQGNDLGVTLTPATGGGFLVASYDPNGPTHGAYDPGWAHVGFGSSTGTLSWSEQTFSPYDDVYGGVSVASLPDGGAIGVWSRLLVGAVEPGLYTIRVGANGSVLDAPPVPSAARGLRLTFGAGRLRATWPAGAPGTMLLLDVQGREHGRIEVSETAGEAVLQRPAGGPGVYFGRLVRRDGTRAEARVVWLE